MVSLQVVGWTRKNAVAAPIGGGRAPHSAVGGPLVMHSIGPSRSTFPVRGGCCDVIELGLSVALDRFDGSTLKAQAGRWQETAALCSFLTLCRVC